ncbi:19702_t:CDS:2 [Rhizophagus irregularis]|nr:19702_t:CDS:2 [Rhizophagus irregularis]
MFKYCSTYRNESRQDPRAKTCPTPIKATNRVKDPRAKTCPTPIKISSHLSSNDRKLCIYNIYVNRSFQYDFYM